MKRYHLGGALAAFLCILPVAAGATDIGSGDYTRPINGPAELTGDITLNISGGSDAPLAALHAQAPSGAVTGSVRRLTIRADGTAAMVASRESIRLSGPVDISTTGTGANGIWAYGPGASITLDGPVAVGTAGDFSHAVFVYDTDDSDMGLDIRGPLMATTQGTRAYGIYMFGGGEARLGETHILTRGAGSDGIYALGGTLTLNGPTTIRVTDPGAYALHIQGQAPYTGTVITTRLQPGTPNPQRLDIEGPIRVYGSGNRLELDLAAGSHLNSSLLEADNAGVVNLNFYGHDAQWTTGLGSVICNGELNLDFTGGGVWNLPVTDATRAASPSSIPALRIQSGGQFTVRGTDSLRLLPVTSLAANQSGTYLLIQSENALPADLENMHLLSGSLLYRADGLTVATVDGLPTLEALLTRLPTAQALPDVEPGINDLLPDTPDVSDDGGGNPFLALALAQHLNGLSLDEITSALEGAPALARVMPASSLTHNLETRIRQTSPVGGLRGRGPERKFTVPSATSSYDIWMSPLYLHEQESLPRSGKAPARYKADLGGILLGAGRNFGSWSLGGGLSVGGGTGSTSDGALPPTTGRIDYAGGLLYGLWQHETWSLGLEFNFLRTWNKLRQQNPVIPLRARVTVDGLTLETVAARRFAWGDWLVTPNVGLEYSHFIQRSYMVRGALNNGRDMDLFYNEPVRQGLWRTPVGLTLGRRWTPGDGWLVEPELYVRYIPVLGKTRADQRVRRADAPAIRATLAGASLDRHTLETGVGLDARHGPLRLTLSYNWQHSVHRNAHFVSGTLGRTF